LPTTGGGDAPVVLEALHSLKHVNRLAEGQTLVFHPSGLTVVFGDKAGALAESAVTRQLCDALVDEFEQLGVAHLPTSLKARNERGRPKLKLLLECDQRIRWTDDRVR
jgi:hypothetical protein